MCFRGEEDCVLGWDPEDKAEIWGLYVSPFAVNTWLMPFVYFGPNGAAWTICTLTFWYWCFPFILPRFQRLTDKQLAQKIVRQFWISIGLIMMTWYFCLGGIIRKNEEIKVIILFKRCHLFVFKFKLRHNISYSNNSRFVIFDLNRNGSIG